MKRFQLVSILLLLAVGSTAIAQDCKTGQCPLVAVPKAVVSQSAEVVQSVASAPKKVAVKVQSKKPVRGFLKKLFRKG